MSIFDRRARELREAGASVIVASATRIQLDDSAARSAHRKRNFTWHNEAWRYYDEVGEIWFAHNFVGNFLSRIRIFAALEGDEDQPPETITDKNHPAMVEMRRLEQGEGTGAMLHMFGVNLGVPGEALDVTTPVATPDGFVPMGDLKAGDIVLSGDGQPCRVLVAHPVNEDRDCYEVRFTGGASVVADGEHLWSTETALDRAAIAWRKKKPRPGGKKPTFRGLTETIVTTAEMADSVKYGKYSNYAVRTSVVAGSPLPKPQSQGCRFDGCIDKLYSKGLCKQHYNDQLAGKPLRRRFGRGEWIDPYILGYWLGDGASAHGLITCHTDDQPNLREHAEAAGYRCTTPKSHNGYSVGILGLRAQLRWHGLLNNKHIPAAYLRADEATRWALLQGMIDSDGHIDRRGTVEFSCYRKDLLLQFGELAASLGLKPGRADGHRLNFTSGGRPVARLPRKAERIGPHRPEDERRYVKSVERVKSRPVRCITVDSPDNTFLVTDRFIKTHNCLLLGYMDPQDGEQWGVYSMDQVIVDGNGRWRLRADPLDKVGTPLDPATTVMIRIWRNHPRWKKLSDSPMRPLLSLLDELQILSRSIRSTGRSRLAGAGLLLWPKEAVPEPSDPTRQFEPGQDSFVTELIEAMTTPIADEGTAAAVVPLVVKMAADHIANVTHVKFDRAMDNIEAEQRTEVIKRIAYGLDIPSEVLTGTKNLNHWPCDEQTEVFTIDRGFVTHDQLSTGDLVLSLDHRTGLSEWVPLSGVRREHVTDRAMVRVQTPNLDALTTPDHRWPILRDGIRLWVDSEELRPLDRVIRAAPHSQLPTVAKWSDAFVELVAWYSADGTAIGSTPQVRIGKSHKENPDKVAALRRLFTELFGPATMGPMPKKGIPRSGDPVPRWKEDVQARGMTLFCPNKAASASLLEVVPSKEKVVPLDFILSLTSNQLRLFIETFAYADGNLRPSGGLSVNQRMMERLDPVALAAILAGRPVSFNDQERTDGFSDGIQHYLNVPFTRGYESPAGETTRETYTGTIFCPQVPPTASFLARRNGKVYYTGNSAWLIDEQTFKAHLEPLILTICSSLTRGYLKPALEGTPDHDRAIVWYDASGLLGHPNRAQDAKDAWDREAISNDALRRYLGFSDTDAPGDQELEQRIAVKKGTLDPATVISLLQAAGLLNGVAMPAATSPAPLPAISAPSKETPPSEPGVPDTLPDSGTPTGTQGYSFRQNRLRNRGSVLTTMDRELRRRIIDASDAAVNRALDRAGAKVRRKIASSTANAPLAASLKEVPQRLVMSTVGVDVAQAFGVDEQTIIDEELAALEGDYDTWVASAQDQVRSLAKKWQIGEPDVDWDAIARQQDDDRHAGWLLLAGLLSTLALNRMFNPNPEAPKLGEHDQTMTVPTGLVRASLARAGGAQSVTSAQLDKAEGGIATGDMAQQIFVDVGLSVAGYVWIYGNSLRPFEPHVELDGVYYTSPEDPVLATSNFAEADWLGIEYFFPNDHDGCLPAGTLVSGPVARGATLRWHEGPMVELSFASGEFLTATPNHPILTDRGWVGAGSLQEGDEIVRCVDTDGIAALIPDVEQVPSPIEDVVASLGVAFGTASVPVAAEHFHGDGTYSNVAVVATDRQLRNSDDPSPSKSTKDEPLPSADLRIGLPTDSGEDEFVLGLDASGGSLVGGGSLSDPLLGGHALPSGTGDIASDDSHLSVCGCHLCVTLLGGQLGPDVAPLLAHGAEDSSLLEHAEQRPVGDVGFPTECQHGFARLVASDKVINVRVFDFAGHVHNLETSVGWYLANGVIVHNCQCDFEIDLQQDTGNGEEG